ncbi:MAG: hypothetical protein AVDCRST_MAG49-1290 [uncultured Thermomicrobiales bacterium]|uniref:Uncharacterized protein n=1 Tax=uncultured Thermomicrobiales bacterium TaxID=1645740 RepID=A0A6J4UAR5_9BACT|nr:MAG: hypothetical protein AVDCRST_MAG49-1290 [uncultured Thermomicrobiales bacterium]
MVPRSTARGPPGPRDGTMVTAIGVLPRRPVPGRCDRRDPAGTDSVEASQPAA